MEYKCRNANSDGERERGKEPGVYAARVSLTTYVGSLLVSAGPWAIVGWPNNNAVLYNLLFKLKNDQIVRLEERLQESEQQVRVLENAASRAGDEMRASSASLAQRDAELAQMRGALAAAQAAHTAATKRCEEIRSDLLGAVEQQQQESDRALRQKEKQIESLQESLNSLQKESDKSSKRNVSVH